MSTRMTFSQYAASRGVSQPAVSKAVQTGRITSYTDEKGVKYVIKEESDIQWAQRSEPRGGPRPAPALDEQAPAEPTAAEPGKGIPPYQQSKAIKEAYLARATKLKFDTDSGKVVPVEEVKARYSALVSLARTKILGIPSKYRGRCPETTTDAYLILESIVRESLEDMADGVADG